MHKTSSSAPSFPRLLWMSFRGTLGTLVGVSGLILAVAAWFIPATEKISLALYVVTLLVAISAIVTLVEATRLARLSTTSSLPRVRLAIWVDQTSEESPIILMLEESTLFSLGLMVSVFILEQDQYERFFARGVVQNIQDDGLIQVRLEQLTPDATPIIDSLRTQQIGVLSRLRIKPYVLERTINFY